MDFVISFGTISKSLAKQTTSKNDNLSLQSLIIVIVLVLAELRARLLHPRAKLEDERERSGLRLDRRSSSDLAHGSNPLLMPYSALMAMRGSCAYIWYRPVDDFARLRNASLAASNLIRASVRWFEALSQK